jgi:hypothetical protein
MQVSARRKFPGAAAAVALLALAACAGPSRLRSPGYCAPPTADHLSIPSERPSPNASDEERIAALIGLSAALREEPRSEGSRLLVLERVEAARLAVAAIAAELDCERQRATQAADTLSRSMATEAQALTIASIGAAAATSIVSVLLSTKNASAETQDSVAIAGGAVTAGLALGSFYVHPTLDFRTPRNLLEPLWSGAESSPLYPAFVWAYLTRPEFSNDRQNSIRTHLVDRWRHEVDLGGALAALLFGSGGAYDVDALRTRAALLDEVAGEVKLENQDLASAFASFVGGTGTKGH